MITTIILIMLLLIDAVLLYKFYESHRRYKKALIKIAYDEAVGYTSMPSIAIRALKGVD